MKPLNPFYISGYNEKYFCDRQEETRLLTDTIENGRNILIHSPRRLGKTSVIKHFLHQMRKKKVQCIYVDLYSTYSMNELVEKLAREVLETFYSHNLLSGFKKVLKGITANFTLGQDGLPSLSLTLNEQQVSSSLKQLFEYLDQKGELVVVAFDEFQQMVHYNRNAEAELRSYIQHLSNVRFVFSGSSAHLLTEMFLSAKRPFYQSSDVMSLRKIDGIVYSQFIRSCFENAGKEISEQAIELIMDFSEGYTYYTQVVSNLVFSITSNTVEVDSVQKAILQVLDSRKDDYTALFRMIPVNQLKLLKAVAREGEVKEISAKRFLNTYQLSSATAIQARNVLLEKEFLYETDQGVVVYDLFLKRFIQRF